MTSTLKKLARPTIGKPNEGPDPVGFTATLARMFAELQEGYHARLDAFLSQNLIVEGLAPAVRESIFAAVTARGQPVSADFRITFHPADAHGFFRADGELMTPVAELATEAEPDWQSDDPEYVDVEGLFSNTVRMHRPKGGWRKFRRRK
jgi:hypothetical protein